jgi:TonB family protein
MTTPLPAAIGRYPIAGLIGRGGMGVVYRALDNHIGRPVAIKVLNAVGEDMRARFMQEIRLLGTLNHPNIVTIHDCGTHEEQPFIVMEYVDGVTLADYISCRPPDPLPRKLQIVRTLCSAIEFAHIRGIVHRDIKPANVMIARDGVLKVLDFGVARFGDASTMTAVVGTPSYMAPEQIAGRGVDKRTDVYAVGLVLYEVISSVQAFPSGEGRTFLQVLHAVLTERPAPLSQIVPGVDPTLERIVTKAIDKDPTARYQTLSLLAADLAAAEDRHARMLADRSAAVAALGSDAAAVAALDETRAVAVEPAIVTPITPQPIVPSAPPVTPQPRMTPLRPVVEQPATAQPAPAAGSTPQPLPMSPPQPVVEQPVAPQPVAAGIAPPPSNTTMQPATPQPAAAGIAPPPSVTTVQPVLPQTAAGARVISRGRAYAIGAAAAAIAAIATAGLLRLMPNAPAESSARHDRVVAGPPPSDARSLDATVKTPAVADAMTRGGDAASLRGGTGDAAARGGADAVRGRAGTQSDRSDGRTDTSRRDKRSAYDQAVSYLSSGSTLANATKAATLLQQACDASDMRGCSDLGELLESGTRIPKDEARAVGLYKRACDGGAASGCSRLGAMTSDGRGTPKDLSAGVALYTRACDGGSFEGCTNLGIAYSRAIGVPRDEAKAAALFSRACDNGYGAGCTNQGRAYLFGRGVVKDLVLARGAFVKGCDRRDQAACLDLAMMTIRGDGGEKHVARGLELLEKSCDAALLPACYQLGLVYVRGEDAPRDARRAFDLFQRSCDGGVVPACTGLGRLYRDGRGVARDERRSVVLFQRACDANGPPACYDLGVAYANGRGVPKDDAQALGLFQRACTGPWGDGCLALGLRYARGQGVPRNEAEAAKWFQKGCDARLTAACDRLNELKQSGGVRSTQPGDSGDAGNDTPIRVGGDVRPPTKIKDVKPAFPADAQRDRIQGVVVLEVVIGRDGKVTRTKVLRSVPALDAAAEAAVRQWEYTPTIVRGGAVPVLMTVTVQFTLQ